LKYLPRTSLFYVMLIACVLLLWYLKSYYLLGFNWRFADQGVI